MCVVSCIKNIMYFRDRVCVRALHPLLPSIHLIDLYTTVPHYLIYPSLRHLISCHASFQEFSCRKTQEINKWGIEVDNFMTRQQDTLRLGVTHARHIIVSLVV